MKKHLSKKPVAFIILLMMFTSNIDAQWLTLGTNIYNNNSGNVGIGINAPLGKVHINTSGLNPLPALYISGNNSSISINSASIKNFGKDLNISAFPTSGVTLPPPFPQEIPGNLLLQSSARTGYVGIGNSAPVQKLHVTGASILANNTSINANTTPNAIIAGAINDGLWGLTMASGIGGKGGVAGSAWAIGTTGSALNFNFSNGTIDNTMQPAMQIMANRNVSMVPWSGNVGIGLALPTQKLHVNGASILANSSIISSNAAFNSVIAGSIRDGSGWGVVSGIGGKGNNAGSAWAIGTTGSGLHLGFSNGSVDNTMYTGMQIMANRNILLNAGGTGNVGIGTSAPEANLHVSRGSAGNVTANSNALLVLENANSSYINLLTPNTFESGILFGDNLNPQDGGIIYTAANQLLLRTNGNVNRMIITPTGEVGIGTTSPVYKLDVCGSVRAKEMRVETGWCDYVFANDYKLPPLSYVESFIKKNKHLPEVTPGVDIENNGLEVGKISSQMIKKIEELTLYAIEQEKSITLLKKQNARFADQINLLINNGGK